MSTFVFRVVSTLLFTTSSTQGLFAATASPPGGDQVQEEAQSGESGISDIVVTATRTGETRAQKTPLAMTVLSAQNLETAGAVNVKDLVTMIPNLSVGQQSANAQIFIRGIGSNNVFSGADPSVTVQSDGVYIARSYSQFTDFVDIDRVEVLRGPQGTLYGRNAIGGTINIVSRKPTDTFEGKALAMVGTYATVQGQGYVSGPLIPGTLQASVAVNYIRHDGYVDNILPGKADIGTANRGGIRGQLRFEPSDGIEMITRADFSKGSERIDAYAHPTAPIIAAPLASSTVGDLTRVALDNPPLAGSQIWGVSQEINLQLSSNISLKSLTAYRHSHYDFTGDVDATEVPYNRSMQADTSKQITQEFNLVGHTDHLDAIIGAYYFHEHADTFIEVRLAPSILTPTASASSSDIYPISIGESKAVFAQATYHATTKLKLTAGIRYTKDRKSIDQTYARTSLDPARLGVSLPGFPIMLSLSRKFDALTPKFGVDYQATPGLLLYASATRGYKSGGTNFAGTSIPTLSFDPEKIWAYEAGIKSDWFDRRLRINVALFRYNYTDLQVQTAIAAGINSIGNAAKARTTGIEIESTAKPVDNLYLTANFSVLSAKYTSFPASTVPVTYRPYVLGLPAYNPAAATYDAGGNYLSLAPRTTFSLSARYNVQLLGQQAYVRGEYYHQSRSYNDPTNVLISSQKPYGVLNLGLGYDGKHGWSAQVIGKNVLNEHYLTNIVGSGLVPTGQAGAPRTIALQLVKGW